MAEDYFPIELDSCTIRDWMRGDEPSLVRHANNRNVSRSLRDTFPYPYTLGDAQSWVNLATSRLRGQVWAIDIGGFAVGGIGLHAGTDVNRLNAEIGYWVGEEFWGRGVATDAVRAVTRWGLGPGGFARIFAQVFDGNAASVRVLEKADYRLEGRMRLSAFKAGQLIDQLLFACVREK